MKLAGMIKNSFVDYPQQIATVVFTSGCNMNCYFCHNRQLIDGTLSTLSEEEVIKFLTQKVGKIDGVVISGGEPTIQPGLVEFIQTIKALGFLVKLDTNGTNPILLKQLIESRLVDFVAMDIKAPISKLHAIAKAEMWAENIAKSISIILTSGVQHEFRTTVIPDLSMQDLLEMVQSISGAQSYALQRYRPPQQEVIVIPRPHSFYVTALDQAKQIVPNSFLRGF